MRDNAHGAADRAGPIRDLAGVPCLVLGGGGFIGGAVVRQLTAKQGSVVSIARADVDLLGCGAAQKLAALLQPDDAVVVAAARAP